MIKVGRLKKSIAEQQSSIGNNMTGHHFTTNVTVCTQTQYSKRSCDTTHETMCPLKNGILEPNSVTECAGNLTHNIHQTTLVLKYLVMMPMV